MSDAVLVLWCSVLRTFYCKILTGPNQYYLFFFIQRLGLKKVTSYLGAKVTSYYQTDYYIIL
jgi:hypothetical protein